MKRFCCILILFALFAPRLIASDDSRKERMVDQILVQAVNLYDSRKMQDAYNLLRQADQLDPDNDAVHYYLGNVFALTGDSATALKHYLRAYQLDSANVWYGSRLAAAYNALQRPEDALAILERLQKLRPNDPEIMSSAMESCLMVASYQKADSLLNRIEIINGESDYTRLSRMEIQRQSGDFQAFFAGMKDYVRSGNMDAAGKVDMIRKVLQSGDPRFNYAHLDDYVDITRSCLEAHPSDTSATHFAVGMFYSAERKDEILQLCDEHKDDAYMARVASSIYIERNDYKSAISCIDRVFSISGLETSDYADAHAIKGDCYQNMDQHDRAFKEYDQVLKIDPDNIVVLNNYAYAMACMDRNLSKCARMSRKTIEAEPDNGTYLDTYAWILYKQKKYKQARTYMKKSLLYGGKDSADVLEHYACILEALGEKTLSRAYREQAEYKRNAKK